MTGLAERGEAFRVVFDLDGTLVDAMPRIGRDLLAMFNELAASPSNEAEFRARYASRFDAVFEELCADGRRMRADVYAEWVARTAGQAGEAFARQAPTPRAPELPVPFDGVGRLLEGLLRAGARLYLWTTRDTASTQALLGSANWGGVFTDYQCGDSGAPPKPATKALESMLGTDCPRDRVAVVGDGVSDIQAGRAFGCRTVGAAWCSWASPHRLAAAGADSLANSPLRCSEVLVSFFRSSGERANRRAGRATRSAGGRGGHG